MPTLSTLYDKFIRRATLTTQDKTDIRNDIGAGVPPTADSVLALLEGEDIEVTSIGLTDGTGTALAAGRLTLNATGDVVVHDNESNAEDLPHLVNSRGVSFFAKRVAFTSGATQTHLIASYHLKSSEVTNGKLLHFAGQIRALWDTNKPTGSSVNLVICRQGQAPATDGFRIPIATPTTLEIINLHLPVTFDVVMGNWTLTFPVFQPSGVSQKNSTGTITHAASLEFGTDIEEFSAVSGPVGEPVVLEFYIRTSNSSALGSEYLFVSGNLAAISQ